MKTQPTAREQVALINAGWTWAPEGKEQVRAEYAPYNEVYHSLTFAPGTLEDTVYRYADGVFGDSSDSTLDTLIWMDAGDLVDSAHELQAMRALQNEFDALNDADVNSMGA